MTLTRKIGLGIAAGIVLVQEATGVVRSLREDSDVMTDGHILAAGSRLIDALQQRLLGGS